MFDELDREIYSSDQIVFKHGEMGDCAYLIEEGRVEILVAKNEGDRRIRVIGKGELFGEVSLIDYQPRTATVRAIEKTILVPIPRKMMVMLLKKSDPVLQHLLLVILERFRHRNELSAPAETMADISPEYSRQREFVKGEATQKLSLAHGMQRALTHEEFKLYYQPICELSTGRVAGFEALIRWHHPIEGVKQPNDFLWIAEQTGHIHEIGLWAFERACSDWKALRLLTEHDAPFVSVNLSPIQLNDERMVDNLIALAEKHKANISEIKLELTETVMVDNPEAALKAMERLIGMGFSIALDDYGAGHSGLRHLQRYPISSLKIDGDFVLPILKSAQSLEIVRSTVALAHSLGMSAIAESIENKEVAKKIQEMKCDFGQGMYFGKPETLHDLEARFSKTDAQLH